MRFMIIVKATADSEAGVMPDQRIFDAMADYHQQLQEAGVLLGASGLQPSAKGWRIMIAGYTLIQVKSRDEALDWARRFPNPTDADAEIEVRQLYELDDFQPSEAVRRFRDIVGHLE